MTSRKKIIFLSGKKGGFTAMLPLLQLFKKSKNFILKTVLTDQHTQKKFGNTYKICQKELGTNFTKVIKFADNTGTSINRLHEMSKLLLKFSKYLVAENPDMVFLYGDRLESLIAGISASNLNIPISHFQGGDVSGNIDEKIRHSITKLSDLHFVSNSLSLRRVMKMGEDKRACFNIGDNHIDALKKINFSKSTFYKLNKKYKINYKNYIVFMLHPENSSDYKNSKNAEMVLRILKSLNFNVICVYPCTDPGYQGIINKLNKYKIENNKFSVFKILPHSDFISLLKHSLFFIGNSSSGIIESSYLRIPSIDIGSRQNKRLKSKNVIKADFNKKSINTAINLALSSKYKNKNIYRKKFYGNGLSY
ncbi:UDP-N-acetylglucosamine 2-epimerase, partial [Candidatus Pelagibacter bacterium]|nr:UDP-N-acetylglucosamine 2-epimerase [Candidatus Pelagibacter bacterium]